MTPRRGDVFVWSGRGVFSRLIQLFTRSRWSHAGWFISPDKALEATPYGVVVVSANKFLSEPDRLAVLRLPLPRERVEAALARALTLVGRGYDFALIAWLAWSILVGRKCRGEAREWRSAYVCSELVAQPLYEVSGFRFVPDDYDVDATTPEDIYRKLSHG